MTHGEILLMNAVLECQRKHGFISALPEHNVNTGHFWALCTLQI